MQHDRPSPKNKPPSLTTTLLLVCLLQSISCEPYGKDQSTAYAHDLNQLELHTLINLCDDVPPSPWLRVIMAGMMDIVNLTQSHQLQVVTTVGEELHHTMVTMWHCVEQCMTKLFDGFWTCCFAAHKVVYPVVGEKGCKFFFICASGCQQRRSSWRISASLPPSWSV